MKKRIVSIVLSLGMCFLMFSNAIMTSSEISIYTISDLRAMQNSSNNFTLMNTLDLSAENWTPISGFTGSFNGNASMGFQIRNLSSNSGGLFGEVNGGEIKNLVLSNMNINTDNGNIGGVATFFKGGAKIEAVAVINSSITGNGSLGGLVSFADNGSYIKNSFVGNTTITRKSYGDAHGGIAGNMGFTPIENCYFNGTINNGTADAVGGIVGNCLSVPEKGIKNCYSTGEITFAFNNCGGIVGKVDKNNWGTPSVTGCYAFISSLSAMNSNVGRIISSAANATLSGNYAYGQMGLVGIEKGTSTINGEDILKYQFENINTYYGNGWDSAAWIMGSTYNLPILTSLPQDIQNALPKRAAEAGDDKVLITEAKDLALLNNSSGSFKIGADLDFSSVSSFSSIQNFSGTLNGAADEGYRISNYNFSTPLFDEIKTGAVIENLVLDNFQITSGENLMGALARKLSYATLTNTALINSSVQGNAYVGGLVGVNNHGLIKGCAVKANVRGTENIVGGIYGLSEFGKTESCYFVGSVSGINKVGGIAGVHMGEYIKYCYTAGEVSGSMAVGGIVGMPFADDNSFRAIVSNNVSTVKAVAGEENTGRISGYNSDEYVGNNFAYGTLPKNGTADKNKKDGQTISYDLALNFETYEFLGFDSYKAGSTSYKMPILKGISDEIQDGTCPLPEEQQGEAMVLRAQVDEVVDDNTTITATLDINNTFGRNLSAKAIIGLYAMPDNKLLSAKIADVSLGDGESETISQTFYTNEASSKYVVKAILLNDFVILNPICQSVTSDVVMLNFTYGDRTDSSITLKWDNIEGAISYDLTESSLGLNMPNVTSPVTIENLNGSYTFSLTAVGTGITNSKTVSTCDNLALNKTYAASSTEAYQTPSELSPSFVFDNNDQTRWSSVGGDVVNGYIEVDFGENTTFDSCLINECKLWGYMTSFNLQYYSNGEWITFYEGYETDPDKLLKFNPVTGSKFRVSFGGGTGSTVTIYEIRIFNGNVKPANNLAKNKLYTSNSEDNINPVSNAFDSNSVSFWQTTDQNYVIIDFGKATRMNKITINEVTQNQKTPFTVEVWKDGWSTVYSGSEIINDYGYYFDDSISAKLKITFNGQTKITEIGAYYDMNRPAKDTIGDGYFALPFTPNALDVSGEYLYLIGGYHSIDDGCPDWGSNDSAQLRFLGDNLGEISITYQDGTTQILPLILGYTMWVQNMWSQGGAPFKTSEVDEALKEKLQSCLYLQGAYESAAKPVLKVKIPKKAVKSIVLKDNTQKNGVPLFSGGYIVDDDSKVSLSGGSEINLDNNFLASHTIDIANSYPAQIETSLAELNDFFVTTDEDIENASDFTFPENYTGSKIKFSGTKFAEVASGVLYHNSKNLEDRTDSDGFMHTSFKDAPLIGKSIGTWIPDLGCFYTSFYSRDGARGIMSLSNYGNADVAEAAAGFANRWMMYYPENNLSILNKAIPGHYSVIPNQPLVYSEVLAPAGWPTKYTKALFGDGYKNLGNQETDGHGLMMMANWSVWKNKGATAQWVTDNWKYINEGAKWIEWCFENPDVSFAQNGLLYGESEGGLTEYTMYNNLPCYLGLRMYAQMAEKIGNTQKAALWNSYADTIYAALENKFTEGQAWTLNDIGFFHDPVPTMFSDLVGYDLQDMPSSWFAKSQNTYDYDMNNTTLNGTYFGAKGIGYDHNMITQNSLLLDRTADSDKFVNNLAKLSYNQNMPYPYIVTEFIAVENGNVRKQGDVGNLVQLAETVKSFLIVSGVSPVRDNVLKILPRLPKDWNMDLSDYNVANSNAKLYLSTTHPKNNAQTIRMQLSNNSDINKVVLRFGPFDSNVSSVSASVNSQVYNTALVSSGDSKWCYINIENPQNTEYVAVVNVQ